MNTQKFHVAELLAKPDPAMAAAATIRYMQQILNASKKKQRGSPK